MKRKKVLLLTLVHPDFLPPVHAVARSLRDLDYDIHILTFDSFVPDPVLPGENIELEVIGNHHNSSILRRIGLRNKFINRAGRIATTEPIEAVISFCPFSFHCGVILKKSHKLPLIYMALEIADFRMSVFLKSPLSNYRNYRALKTIGRADLVATPSVQRSAWLAGRCHINFMPYTILNTAYNPVTAEDCHPEVFRELVPTHFAGKKIIIYTGAVNSDLCVLELLQAFDRINDARCALVITGMKDTEYCKSIEQFAAGSNARDRMLLLPYVTRTQMLSLQAHAHIGACLVREDQNSVKSKMMAPNKAGEYMQKRLYLLGIMSEYFRPLAASGVASLAASPGTDDVAAAMKEALHTIEDAGHKERISAYVQDFFCMQQQLKPVVELLRSKAAITK